MFDSEDLTKTLKYEDNLRIRASVTYNQFLALSNKLEQADLENDLVNNKYFKGLKQTNVRPLFDIEKWLKNSWNTEKVLFENRTIIENTGQSFAMQWAFAQSYYTTFGSLLAHFKSVGHTETSHTAVLKKLGKLMEEEKLPAGINFYSTGGKNDIRYVNIVKPHEVRNLELDTNRKETIDNQICQFLKATRVLKLIDKAQQLKFKTKKNKPRKSLGALEWLHVSNSIGHTTIMDLLYRKRIKANYDDIDTFNYEGFRGLEVLDSLCTITNRLNLVNECFIAKSIGIEQYTTMLNSHLRRTNNSIVKERMQTVLAVVSAANT